MNETLLNNLRALADSTKHRLPEGWKGELNNCNEPYFHSRGDLVGGRFLSRSRSKPTPKGRTRAED